MTHAPVHYAFYKGTREDAGPENVLVENLDTRSRLYDWQIEPHTHPGMLQMIFLRNGQVQCTVDSTTQMLEAPGAVCIPGGAVHSFVYEPEAAGWVMTVSETLLDGGALGRARPLFEVFLRKPLQASFANNPTDASRLDAVLSGIARELKHPEPGQGFVLEWAARTALVLVRRQLDNAALAKQAGNRSHALYSRYRELVETRFKDHLKVADYAKALGTTPTHLNRVCRKIANTSAGDMAKNRLLLEAERHLIYSPATAEAIAYALGFSDPAYFSRFFKKVTGTSPGKYRARYRAQERH